MSDLLSGRYSQQELFWRILGMQNNATQSDIPIRSNLPLFGLGSLLTDAAQAATKKGWFVAIPVSEGDSFSKVSILVGGTKGAAGKAVAGIYSGAAGTETATLLANSAKAAGEAEIKAETLLTLELEKSVIVTSVTAPHGYIYAGIATESAEINTAITAATCKTIALTVLNKVFTGAPKVLATAVTVAGAGELPATMKPETAVETAPIVFLQ